jgi:uncharacterized integral membrane protein
MIAESNNRIYQGQFGEYTITKSDRQSVIVYRSGLILAAVCVAIAANLAVLPQPDLNLISLLYVLFSLGLGTSLWTIHIYLKPLHRLLQLFWLVGTITAAAIAITQTQPLALFVYNQPLSLWGIGFTFAALTGIYFKEAFCFNRLETKFLTPLVPFLLLGHLFKFLPIEVEQLLLLSWSILFGIFAIRKILQPLDPDIGDKSVFEYLKQQNQS